MLNTLWLGFFLTAALAALSQWLIGGNAQIFAAMVEALFSMAGLAPEAQEEVQAFLAGLENNDDVQNVYVGLVD